MLTTGIALVSDCQAGAMIATAYVKWCLLKTERLNNYIK